MTPRSTVPFPVPSASTLRFLRHVVLYSSFGTFAGAAVLLAEERRRRIHVARKIIDNGKVLRECRHLRRTPGATSAVPHEVGADLDALLLENRSPYAAGEVDKAYKKLGKIHSKRKRKRKAAIEKSSEETGSAVHQAANALADMVLSKHGRTQNTGPSSTSNIRRHHVSPFRNLPRDFKSLSTQLSNNPNTRRYFSTNRRNMQIGAAAQYSIHDEYDSVGVFQPATVPRQESSSDEGVNNLVHSRSTVHDSQSVLSDGYPTLIIPKVIPSEHGAAKGGSDPDRMENSERMSRQYRVPVQRTRGQGYKAFYEYYLRRYEPDALQNYLASDIFPPGESDNETCMTVKRLFQAADLSRLIDCYERLSKFWRKRQKYLTTSHFQHLGVDLMSIATVSQQDVVKSLNTIWACQDSFRNTDRQPFVDVIVLACKQLLQDGQEQSCADLLFSTVLRNPKKIVPEIQTNDVFSMDEIFDAILSDPISAAHRRAVLSIGWQNTTLLGVCMQKILSRCEELLSQMQPDEACKLLDAALEQPWFAQGERAQARIRKLLTHPSFSQPSLGEQANAVRTLLNRLTPIPIAGVSETEHQRLPGDVCIQLEDSEIAKQAEANHSFSSHDMRIPHPNNAGLQPIYCDPSTIPDGTDISSLDAIAHASPIDSAIQEMALIISRLPSEQHQSTYDKYFPKLLSRCYYETRSYTSVQGVYEDIKSRIGEESTSHAILERLVYIQIKSLRHNDTIAFAELGSEWALLPRTSTLRHFRKYVHAFARQANWEAVDLVLRHMHSNGLFQTQGASESVERQASQLLSNAVQELAAQQDSKSVLRFVLRTSKRYGIKPNNRTLRLVLTALVKDGRTSSLIPWMRYFRRRGWRLEMDGKACVDLLITFDAARRPSERILLEIRQVLTTYDETLVSKEYYDMLRLAFARLQKTVKPKSWKRAAWETWFQTWLKQIEVWEGRADNAYNSRPSFGNLAFTPSKDPQTLLDKYERLVHEQRPQGGRALEMAVKASLKVNHNNPAHAKQLVAKVQEMGVEVSSSLGPLAAQRMLRKERPVAEIHHAVMKHYKERDESGLDVSHDLTISVARELINRQEGGAAVRILASVYGSPWAKQKALGIEFMTCFLQAYTSIGHLRGVDWVAEEVLKQQLLIDLPYLREFRLSRRAFQRAALTKVRTKDEYELQSKQLEVRLKELARTSFDRYKAQRATTARMGWELTWAIVKGRTDMGSLPPHKTLEENSFCPIEV